MYQGAVSSTCQGAVVCVRGLWYVSGSREQYMSGAVSSVSGAVYMGIGE